MQKSGEKLRSERLKKGYTLERIEHEIKIKKTVLSKIEEGDFKNLPPSTFVKGFIRNYAIFLKEKCYLIMMLLKWYMKS